MAESVLVLVRHGQSEWNEKNLFTGWKDPDLTQKGVDEATSAGTKLKAAGYTFDLAYTSELLRAQKTLDLLLAELGQSNMPITRDIALNERDYGDLSGLNKDDAREKWGAEQVHIWRRSYDTPPPGGESLKDTAARTLPYFDAEIMPQIKAGKAIVVAAHGNSLRSIVMQLDNLSREEVIALEIATGVPIVYKLDSAGKVLEKTILE
ncbi:MAG: 2,3-bisphosphoglycerate-dependent phosphoglycerate mutase [Hyphomicrobiaceae bacterium]